MFFNFRGINIHYDIRGDADSYFGFIMIHGFSGSLSDWYEIVDLFNEEYIQEHEFKFSKNSNLEFPGSIKCCFYLIDLPGHGKSGIPIDIKYYEESFLIELIDYFLSLIYSPVRILIAYSMGGRLAISYTCKYPEKINYLIIESSSSGINNSNEREERIREDNKLAEFIKVNSISDFVDYWLNMKIFKTLQNRNEEFVKDYKTRKLNNSKIGLINTQKGFGSGVMLPKSELLRSVKTKIFMICGKLDKKYLEINKSMHKLIKNSELFIIENAGHNVHFEQPKEFVNVLFQILKTIKEKEHGKHLD